MKKLLIALIIAAASSGAYAYNAKCQFDNSKGYLVDRVNIDGVNYKKMKCYLNGHIFYVRG